MSEHTITQSTDQEGTVHESAVRMQTQFAMTGSYDAQDVTKVLGDPRDSVRFDVPEAYSLDTSRITNCIQTTQLFIAIDP